jgi:hypothetical protein
MYLVSPDHFHATEPPASRVKPSHPKKRNCTKTRKQHTYDKWFAFRKKMQDIDVRRKTQIKMIAEFLKQIFGVIPANVSSTQTVDEYNTQTKAIAFPSTSGDETSNTLVTKTEEDEGGDNRFVEEYVRDFGTRNFGKTASPFLTQYLYGTKSLDTQYGIRKENGVFMIGDSAFTVDNASNIRINGKEYKGTSGLWELLTSQTVNRKKITEDDLKTYKSILELTNAHLEGYEPSGNIQITRGPKFREIISKLFPPTRRRGVEVKSRQQ